MKKNPKAFVYTAERKSFKGKDENYMHLGYLHFLKRRKPLHNVATKNKEQRNKS